jgi:hypothetical protein
MLIYTDLLTGETRTSNQCSSNSDVTSVDFKLTVAAAMQVMK